MTSQRVAVLGASPKPESYANKAVRMLLKHGHQVFAVTPNYEKVEGLDTAATLADLKTKIDTLTIYIGPKNIGPMIPDIVALRPARVILNPGTESPALITALKASGITYLEACTLVLLSTNQF